MHTALTIHSSASPAGLAKPVRRAFRMNALALGAMVMSFLFLGLTNPVAAEPGSLVTTYTLGSGYSFALDPTRSRVYVTLTDSNSLAIIDTNTLQLIDTVFVGSAPHGVVVSPDGNRVFVATSGASFVAVLDANTLQLLPSLPVLTNPSDVEIGANNRLYVTPANQNVNGIMIVDASTGSDLGTFSGSVSIYSGGMLEVSPDGNTLYFGNRGISPGTAAKFDISVYPPTLIYRNPHGDLGSNGQDLALSPDGRYLSYAVGGGNNGYVIYMMDATDDFSVLGSFVTGAYPRVITYSPDSSTAFAVHTSGQIDVFSTSTFLNIDTYPTVGEARDLAVNQTGAYLFAAFDDEIRVYETGLAPASQPCKAETDAAVYGNGDIISITLGLANPGIEEIAVEWKLWLDLPKLGAISLVNAGAEGTLRLPAGYVFEHGPMSLVPVTEGLPRGTGTIGCRQVDPTTGATNFVHTRSFEIQ